MDRSPASANARIARARRGVSFLELIFAITILVVALGALSTALLHAYRSGYRQKERLFAIQLAQAAIEELRGTQFDAVTDLLGMDPTDPDDPISNPVYTVASSDEEDVAKTFTVTLSFRGYGQVAAAGASSLTASFDRGQDAFRPGEFVNHQVMITAGNGEGQVRQITANTTDQLSLDRSWDVTPNATSFFMIDGGKTVTATVTWTQTGTGTEQSLELTALIIPKG